MQTKKAQCCCGDLSITVSGEPERVIACHCDYCQRRTGSVLQVSCWYFEDQIVSRAGEGQVYRGPDNRGVDYSFCRRCGSTVYWQLAYLRQAAEQPIYGIAVGCFADADFPRPEFECWTRLKHSWLGEIEDVQSYDKFSAQGMVPRLT